MKAISIKMGLWMLAGFIAFFLLMWVMSLGHVSELRFFNGAIQIFCLNRAIKTYYALHPEYISNYMSGVLQGIGASAIGVVGFAIFMTIFLKLDPVLMDKIVQSSQMKDYLNPLTASLFILTEGLMIGIIGSYILTRIHNMNTIKE
jgi:hypothetical protein